MKIVIKLGGAALEDKNTLHKCARAIVELAEDGHKVTVVHGGVFDPDVKFIFRKNHSDKVDIITMDANEPTLRSSEIKLTSRRDLERPWQRRSPQTV